MSASSEVEGAQGQSSAELGWVMAGAATSLAQQVVTLYRVPHHTAYEDDADLQAQLQTWRELSVQSEDLTQASAMICEELARQTKQVDRIEDHMGSAAESTLEGAGEVVAADNTKASKWKWQAGSVGALTGGAFGILGGPVGVGIGVFVGTSVGTFIGSIPKMMVQRDCERSKAVLETERHQTDGVATISTENSAPQATDVSESFAEREEMQIRAAVAAAANRRGRRTRRAVSESDEQDSSEAIAAAATAAAEDPRLRMLKLRCLENVLEAVRVTNSASELLESDRDALSRIRREDGTIATAQVIAGHHVTGMEEGWLAAFFRRLRPIPNRPGFVSRVRSMLTPQSNPDAAASAEPPDQREREEIVSHIERILIELRQGQSALGQELTEQVAILEVLDSSVDRRQTKANSLIDRMDGL
eukprot:m.273794 g.273794  ORF g.273794 m.273794 type:complete len:418 (-) comp26886_c5_seq1:109-1362(-)